MKIPKGATVPLSLSLSFLTRLLLSKRVSTLLIAVNLIPETEALSDSLFFLCRFHFSVKVLCSSLAARAAEENMANLIRTSECSKHFLTEYSTEWLCVRFGPGQQFNLTEWKD